MFYPVLFVTTSPGFFSIHPPYSGEELTLDYATFLDARMEPFACHCGALNFMGWQGSFQLTLNDQPLFTGQ